jgi:hypothetical protein
MTFIGNPAGGGLRRGSGAIATGSGVWALDGRIDPRSFVVGAGGAGGGCEWGARGPAAPTP